MATDLRVRRAVLEDADADDAVDLTLTLSIATFEDAGEFYDPTRGQAVLRAVNWVLASQPSGGLTMTVEDSHLPVSALVQALETVGASEHANALRDADKLAAREPQSDEEWTELDDRWWDLDGSDSALAALMWAYVTAHPDEYFSD